MSDSYIAFYKRTDDSGDYPIYDDETWEFFESKEELLDFIASAYTSTKYNINLYSPKDFKLTNVFSLSNDLAMEFVIEAEKLVPKIYREYLEKERKRKERIEREELERQERVAIEREEWEWKVYQELKKKFGDE